MCAFVYAFHLWFGQSVCTYCLFRSCDSNSQNFLHCSEALTEDSDLQQELQLGAEAQKFGLGRVCHCLRLHQVSCIRGRQPVLGASVLPGSSNSLQKSQASGAALAGSWAWRPLLLNVAQESPFAWVCRFLERPEFAAIQSMKP